MPTIFSRSDDTQRCQGCNGVRTRRIADKFIVNGIKTTDVRVCKKCKDRAYTCETCGIMGWSMYNVDDGEHKMCQPCSIEKGYGPCHFCSRLSANSVLMLGRKYHVCQKCMTNIQPCQICNQYEHRQNLNSTKKGLACRQCASKMVPKFESSCCRDYQPPIGDGNMFLGVELEVEIVDGRGDGRNLVLQEMFDTLGEFCIFKNDSSLNYGIETVSCPCTFDVHMRIWDGFFSSVPKDLEARGNCGIHIHVSKSPLSKKPDWIYNIARFINNPENKMLILSVAGRYGTSYCRVYHNYINDRANIISACNTKYSAFNISPANTVEFRLFASTLERDRFIRNIEFVHAVVMFCDPDNTVQGFNQFVLSNPQYKQLNQSLNNVPCNS